jgi:hypothetical protein
MSRWVLVNAEIFRGCAFFKEVQENHAEFHGVPKESWDAEA